MRWPGRWLPGVRPIEAGPPLDHLDLGRCVLAARFTLGQPEGSVR